MNEVLIGEAFIGDGVDAAHVNTVLGERDGPVGTRGRPRWPRHAPVTCRSSPWCCPGLAVQPMTLFVNKAAIEPGRHGELTGAPHRPASPPA